MIIICRYFNIAYITSVRSRLVIGQGRVGLGPLLTDPLGLRVTNLPARPDPVKSGSGLGMTCPTLEPAKKPAKKYT